MDLCATWPTSIPLDVECKGFFFSERGRECRNVKAIPSSIRPLSLKPSFFFFVKFATLPGWHTDPPPAGAESNRNVRSVCLASRGTVRVSGGLKSSWGRVVGRHSSVTFLSCYSHQTPFSSQSPFAAIRIGLEAGMQPDPRLLIRFPPQKNKKKCTMFSDTCNRKLRL